MTHVGCAPGHGKAQGKRKTVSSSPSRLKDRVQSVPWGLKGIVTRGRQVTEGLLRRVEALFFIQTAVRSYHKALHGVTQLDLHFRDGTLMAIVK